MSDINIISDIRSDKTTSDMNIILDIGADILKLSSYVRSHMIAINKRDDRFYELLKDVETALDHSANSILSNHHNIRYTFPCEVLDDPDLIMSPAYRAAFITSTIRKIYELNIRIVTKCPSDSFSHQRFFETALSSLYASKIDKSFYFGLYPIVSRLGHTRIREDKQILKELKLVINIVEQAIVDKRESVTSTLDGFSEKYKAKHELHTKLTSWNSCEEQELNK